MPPNLTVVQLYEYLPALWDQQLASCVALVGDQIEWTEFVGKTREKRFGLHDFGMELEYQYRWHLV